MTAPWQPSSVTTELQVAQEAPAELGLIGCCVLGGVEVFSEVANVTTAEVFSRDIFRQAFELMAEMARESVQIDVASVMVAWLKKFGQRCPQEIWLAPDYTPSAHNWPYYREILMERFGVRQVVKTASDTINAANEGTHNFNELKAMLESVDLGVDIGAFIEGQGPLGESYRKSLREQMAKGDQLAGLSTGYSRVNQAIDGFPLGTMSVVAARPSEGKTALGLSFLYKMCFELQIPCLFISIEMKRNAILNRLASMATRIPAKRIRKLDLSDDEKRKMKWFVDLLKEKPFWFAEAPGATVDDIDRLVRIATKRHQVACVFVDYLQKVSYKGKLSKRHEQVQEISQRLQGLAQRHGPHLCALAQVNRKSAEENRPPRVNEISDTDQIEKDAEIVLLIHRPRDGEGFRGKEANLIFGKVRDGDPGMIKLEFDGPHVQFTDPKTKIYDEDIPKQGELIA